MSAAGVAKARSAAGVAKRAEEAGEVPADEINTPVGGRGEAQTADIAKRAELLRSLVERSARVTPSARRRAIVLADVRLAQSAKGTTRGEA